MGWDEREARRFERGSWYCAYSRSKWGRGEDTCTSEGVRGACLQVGVAGTAGAGRPRRRRRRRRVTSIILSLPPYPSSPSSALAVLWQLGSEEKGPEKGAKNVFNYGAGAADRERAEWRSDYKDDFRNIFGRYTVLLQGMYKQLEQQTVLYIW